MKLGLEMSRAEFDSIKFSSARNSTWVRHKPFFELELDSIQAHEQLGLSR